MNELIQFDDMKNYFRNLDKDGNVLQIDIDNELDGIMELESQIKHTQILIEVSNRAIQFLRKLQDKNRISDPLGEGQGETMQQIKTQLTNQKPLVEKFKYLKTIMFSESIIEMNISDARRMIENESRWESTLFKIEDGVIDQWKLQLDITKSKFDQFVWLSDWKHQQDLHDHLGSSDVAKSEQFKQPSDWRDLIRCFAEAYGKTSQDISGQIANLMQDQALLEKEKTDWNQKLKEGRLVYHGARKHINKGTAVQYLRDNLHGHLPMLSTSAITRGTDVDNLWCSPGFVFDVMDTGVFVHIISFRDLHFSNPTGPGCQTNCSTNPYESSDDWDFTKGQDGWKKEQFDNREAAYSRIRKVALTKKANGDYAVVDFVNAGYSDLLEADVADQGSKTFEQPLPQHAQFAGSKLQEALKSVHEQLQNYGQKEVVISAGICNIGAIVLGDCDDGKSLARIDQIYTLGMACKKRIPVFELQGRFHFMKYI